MTNIDTQAAIAEIASDEGVITDWQTMTLVNKGSDPFTIEYAMQKYIIPANGSLEKGNFAVVPYHAFVLYCGDPRSYDVPGDDKQRYRSDEWKRLRCRYGVYDDVSPSTLQQIPKLEAYTIHGDRVLTVLEDPEGVDSFPNSPTGAVSQQQRTNDLLSKQLAEMQAKVDNLLALQNQQNNPLANPQAIDPEVAPSNRRAKSKSGSEDDLPEDKASGGASGNVKI